MVCVSFYLLPVFIGCTGFIRMSRSCVSECGADASGPSLSLLVGLIGSCLVPRCKSKLVTKSQNAPSKWKDQANKLCNAYPCIIVSAIILIPLIMIIKPNYPSLVVPKLIKRVQNRSHADSAILSIISSLNKFVYTYSLIYCRSSWYFSC